MHDTLSCGWHLSDCTLVNGNRLDVVEVEQLSVVAILHSQRIDGYGSALEQD